MEIKIQCNCGTKYKFDFEPVEGCVPFAVICPSCGVDATDFANSRVQESLGVAEAAAVAEPAASAPAEPRLRVRVNVPLRAEPESAEAAPPLRQPVAPARREFVPSAVTAYTPDDEGLSPKFFIGLVGGALGVLVGCALWYLIFHFTEKNLRILAVLVGATGGLGAKLMSKDEGSSQLGMITSVFALIGIVLTAYFIGRERAHNFVGGLEGDIYKEHVAYSKRAVKAVPNGTDEEIRLFLAKEVTEEGGKPDVEAVEAVEVRRFRDMEFAHLKELASGKVSRKDYFMAEQRWEHEDEVAEAKVALAAMPNETDAEIRVYLAQEESDELERRDPKSVTAEEIKAFRAEDLPELKALASGEKQFVPKENTIAKDTDEVLKDVEDKSPWMKFMYFFAGWGIGGVGIMFVTLGLCYKICTHD